MRDQFNRLAAGAIVLNISSELVKKAILPIPPIDTQRRIAVALEAYSAETQRLAKIYKRKLAALDDLKKSLLHQAFSGEL